MENIIGVYKIINKQNGHFYVGSSINIKKRLDRHQNELEKGIHHSIYLQRAFDKYGKESFDFTVYKITETEDEARELEQKILDTAKCLYNISKKASGGDLISYHPQKDEIIKNISRAVQKRMDTLTTEEKKKIFGKKGKLNPMYGQRHSEEVKKRISEANKGNSFAKGAKRALEQRQRLAKIASQRTGDKNPFFGKKHTEETKQKIAEKRKGILPSNSRKVLIKGIIYESLTDASRKLGVVPATILYRIKSANPKFKEYQYFESQ